ncbi:hypothetical protein PCANC_02922 [Puccinia coronata f. sp. avenae]|uniref:RNA-dependent RNA polymerase n=1 Tax=Puccinia coronata f. sp. avenae TaxID=200324 RepID=A0A2N5T8H5_9BASI|nr:hypothetical protein PCANC_02922 [Puccinia coronata f. sp. avenae]
MSSSTNQAPVPVIGVNREGEETLVINPGRQPEEPEIMEIGSDSDRNDEEPELWEIGPLPNLGDSVHGDPIVNNTRALNSEQMTSYFEESIEAGLAKLDNHLIRWEVARLIFHCSSESQHKVITSDLPSDPRHLDLRSILPWYEVEYDHDAQLLGAIDRIANEIKSDPNASAKNSIEKLVREGEVRFAIDLMAVESDLPSIFDLKCKMANARLAISNELLRTYGSDCWIQFRITEDLLYQIQGSGQKRGIGNDLWQFLHRPLKFYHRIYRTALVKDDSVWFFTSPMDCPRPIHMLDMIQKQLPLGLNRRMKISKFNSRLQLGLSTTTQSVIFTPEQIRRVPDICSNSLRMSKGLMSDIAAKLGLSYVPSAIVGAHKVTKANFIGQRYTWATFDPVGLPNETLLEVWTNGHIASNYTIKYLLFQFSIPIYVKSSKRWKDQKCEIIVQRERIQIRQGKPSGEVLMTDGAAAIGWGAALGIKKILGLNYLPAAYQARILKCKGLWYLSRDVDKSGFWIEIRESQWKADVRCQSTDKIPFNICNYSTRAKAGHVNRQSIPVIVSRNVPVSVFIDRQREAFKAALDSLTTTNSTKLSQALEVHGRLMNLKSKRLVKAANVLIRKDLDDFGAAWEKYSNRPYNVMEEIVELLRSGFSTRNNRVLDRINVAGKQICDKMMNFKVEVGCSATVYVIPDPTGTLQEGEVFLRLSQFKDPVTLLPINVLTGDCVVSRSPCVLPTDARKVKAVSNSRLTCYEDVLVCSIQGDKSLLDYLSGGDYDGDVVIVIWDDAFTKNFVNADDPKYLLPKEKYDNFFAETAALAATGKGAGLPTMRVEDFCNLRSSHGTYAREFCRAQIISLFQPPDYGRYSRMYKASEYLLGISHPLTMKIGYVYTKCLDATKQGITLKPEVDHILKQEFEAAIGDLGSKDIIPSPFWTSFADLSKEENDGTRPQEKCYLPMNPDHVLEAIAFTSIEERKKFIVALREIEMESNDPHLSWPWLSFKARVMNTTKHAHALMGFIESNAQECYTLYKQALAQAEGRTEHVNFEAAGRFFWIEGGFENALGAVKHDKNSVLFLRGKGKIEYNVLRASALAAIAPQQDFFPFHLAFNELCHLKTVPCELNYQAQSGVKKVGHSPRAFAPEFCQAMMSRASLLPPEKEV